nr:hypothetical protein [Pseudomonas viridiflava]
MCCHDTSRDTPETLLSVQKLSRLDKLIGRDAIYKDSLCPLTGRNTPSISKPSTALASISKTMKSVWTSSAAVAALVAMAGKALWFRYGSCQSMWKARCVPPRS